VLIVPFESRFSDHKMINAAIRATAPKTSAINGIGGPQTREERDAVATNEIAQAARTGNAHLRHRKVVNMVNRLSNPQASCTMVSTCCPKVLV